MNADAIGGRAGRARAARRNRWAGGWASLRGFGRAVAAAVLVLAGGASAGRAGEPAPAAEPEPGPAFEVSELKLSYGGEDNPKHPLYKGHPGLPKVADAMLLPVTLGQLADGYVAPRAGVASATFKLSEVPGLTLKKFYPSAILSIEEQLVVWFNRRNLIGIFVAPNPDDVVVEVRVVDKQRKVVRSEDRRPANQKALRLVVWTGVVTKVRTIASGSRVPKETRVDSAVHARIRAHSPLKPAAADAAVKDNLLRRKQLEDYASFLSRHPGRRVDVALSTGETVGGVVLDYLVSENKPWYAYFQMSNTGTKYTAPWRERFGFVHNQLTGRDDILALDYDTARFDESHAVAVSYEAPFFDFDRVRWRLYGSWHKYTASDIGVSSAEFRGKGWAAGAELIANVFQHHAFFLDAVAGARLDHIYVKSMQTGVVGEDSILSPYAGFRFQRLTETASLGGFAIVECNRHNLASADFDELEGFGRLDPDTRWAILKFDLEQAFYLEPLLNPAAWQDPNTYKSSTLAHELAFRVRGQYTFGERLPPQFEQVVGGFFSVRGYPESVVTGDSVYVATAEYRFHVPRILKPKAEPTKLPVFNAPFRVAPPQVYGRPDWDLIFRAFYDVGRVVNNHRASYERDYTLQGIGVGLELRIKNNFSVRCDCATALNNISDPVSNEKTVNSGNKEIHAICTLSF